MRTVFTAKRLWNGKTNLDAALVAVEDGRVFSIAPRGSSSTESLIDLGDVTIAPSFFDVHIHGSAGHDVMEATPEALTAVGHFLTARGTGAYLATTVTAPLDETLQSLNRLAGLIRRGSDSPCAWPVGIHLEGPFLSHEKRGVHPAHLLLQPDIGTFERMFEAAEGQVKLMTLAPELPGAVELARHANERGVRVSLGHSNAVARDARAAIAAGAISATHTFNAMRPLDHREPGILGTVLSTDALYAELICDGIHTAPELVRIWWRSKGPQRTLLVTDAMAATGMPDGTYRLGGFPVQVAHGRATSDGVLAGSVLTLDLALENLIAFTGASVESGLKALTTNPAAMVGLETKLGHIAVGAPANFVAVDDAGKLAASIYAGSIVSR